MTLKGGRVLDCCRQENPLCHQYCSRRVFTAFCHPEHNALRRYLGWHRYSTTAGLNMSRISWHLLLIEKFRKITDKYMTFAVEYIVFYPMTTPFATPLRICF